MKHLLAVGLLSSMLVYAQGPKQKEAPKQYRLPPGVVRSVTAIEVCKGKALGSNSRVDTITYKNGKKMVQLYFERPSTVGGYLMAHDFGNDETWEGKYILDGEFSSDGNDFIIRKTIPPEPYMLKRFNDRRLNEIKSETRKGKCISIR